MMSHIASFCFGASIALLFVMLRTPRKPRGITMHARRQHEYVHRKYRDAEIVATVAPEVGGIRYEHLGMTGEEV